MEKVMNELIARYPALAPCRPAMEEGARLLISALRGGGKVLLCGNGGSAADCGHIAGELLKGFRLRRPLPAELAQKLSVDGPGAELAARLQQGLPAIDLTAQGPVLSAVVNDLGGALGFAQLTLAYGRPGDVLVGLSTSGTAENVMDAFRVARALGMGTLALTGAQGGPLAAFADCVIAVPETRTFAVQEYHLPVYHALCAAVEDAFFTE